jgi:hypothetical protein
VSPVRNVWKGLVVGGLTGVAAGLLLDGLSQAGVKAGLVAERAREEAPEAAGRLRAVVGEKVEHLADTLPDRAAQLKESDTAGKVRQAAARATSEVAGTARQAAGQVKEAAAGAAGSARTRAADAMG